MLGNSLALERLGLYPFTARATVSIPAVRSHKRHVPSCFSRVQFFVAPWTVAPQAPLSMRFSRQGCWSGLPCPSPGDLPDPGIKSTSLKSPALAGSFFTTEPLGRLQKLHIPAKKINSNWYYKYKLELWSRVLFVFLSSGFSPWRQLFECGSTWGPVSGGFSNPQWDLNGRK